jgi:hypothetical protein
MPARELNAHPKAILPAILLISMLLPAGQQPAGKFYDIEVSKNEIYSYENLKFAGDYAAFDSPKGFLALGRTTDGVTILMVLGEGSATIEAPEAVREKFKTVFGAYPVSTPFKTVYMRMNPKEFEEAFGKQTMVKTENGGAYQDAKKLFDDSFMRSYHAGEKVIFPPYKTRVLEFVTAEFGLITTEEGYWLTLRRYSPYGSVYPRDFVNPKKK